MSLDHLRHRWFSPYSPRLRRPGFNTYSPAMYLKRYETIPILILVTYEMCFMGFCIVTGFTRTDIQLTRWTKTQGELTDLLIHPRCRKYAHFDMEYKKNPDLYQAYMDVEEAKKKREEECRKQNEC